MTKTEKHGSLDDLLVDQVTRLIQATANHAADTNPNHPAGAYEAHFYRLIGAECTAKAQAFEALERTLKGKRKGKEP